MSESNIMSGKSTVEQAQMLADYIRSQATKTPQSDAVLKDFLDEQFGKIHKDELLMASLEYEPLLERFATGKAAELLTDRIIARDNFKPSELYISPIIYEENRNEYVTNKEKKISNAGVAFKLLAEFLRADGKDLSALDGGKKSNAELYTELSKIADKQFLNEQTNEELANLESRATTAKKYLAREHELVKTGIDKIANLPTGKQTDRVEAFTDLLEKRNMRDELARIDSQGTGVKQR